MKHWKIIYRLTTGSIFSHEFNTFDQVEHWLTHNAAELRSISLTFAVWELYNNEYKQRYYWTRV